MTAQKQCRACGAVLEVTGIKIVCSRCGYINLELQPIWNDLPWLTPEHANHSVNDLFQASLTKATAWVSENLPAATAQLFRSLARRETLYANAKAPRTVDGGAPIVLFNAAVQLLYLL